MILGKATFKTSQISFAKWKVKSFETCSGTSSRSLRFNSGNTISLIPALCAAVTFSLTPPIGRTLPLRVISPVMATLPFTGVAISTLLKVNNYTDTCGTGCILRAYLYNSSNTDVSSSVYVSPNIHPNDIYPTESVGNLSAATFYSNSAGTSFIANGSYSVDIVRTNCGTANCNNCTGSGCSGGCQSGTVTITNGKWTAYPQGGC